MDDPVAGRLLPDPLLHERLLGAEQLHGQLVVGGREDVLQLVPHPPRVARLVLARHGVSGEKAQKNGRGSKRISRG